MAATSSSAAAAADPHDTAAASSSPQKAKPKPPSAEEIERLAAEVEELRTLKAGLDLRRLDIEEGRRLLQDTQRQINDSLKQYVALRSGLKAELQDVGHLGRSLAEGLEAQRSLLERQGRELMEERFARDALRDEVRRLRSMVREQPVREGVELFAPPEQNGPLWEARRPPVAAAAVAGMASRRVPPQPWSQQLEADARQQGTGYPHPPSSYAPHAGRRHDGNGTLAWPARGTG